MNPCYTEWTTALLIWQFISFDYQNWKTIQYVMQRPFPQIVLQNVFSVTFQLSVI